jgi:hypothetical protein
MKQENKKNYNLNEKEISQFLIWDYSDALEQMGEKDFKKSFSKKYFSILQKYNKYKFALNSLDRIFLKLLIKNNKKILFEGIKYSSIVSEVKKRYPTGLIVKGVEDRLFSLRNFIGYLSLTDLFQYIYYYLAEKNIKYLYQLLEKIENRLKIVKPDYIVLWNDSLPIERAIVLVARRLGIITIDIQHGIYQSTSFLSDGRVADYVLVWGQYFKDLYVKNGIRKSEEVYVLGYPYLIKGHKVNCRKKRHYTVCFLGQAFEKYDKNLLNIKLETINNLYKICKHLGLKFIYRPHPGDDKRMLRDKLAEIIIAPKGEDLEETFERGDIFISFNSSALIEAAIRQKITLQLMNYPMNTDNFENLGVCNKSFVNFKQLAEYLEFLSKLPNLTQAKLEFNANYIETKYHPGKRFLEILKDIKNKK